MSYEQRHAKKFEYLFSRLLRLRWWAIGVMVVVALWMCLSLPLEPWRVWVLLSLVSLLLFVVLPWVMKLASRPGAFAFLQRAIPFGIVVHGILVALTGGIDSPFFSILMLVPMLSGVLWRDVGKARPAAIVATVVIAAIALLQLYGALPGLPGASPPPQAFSLGGRSLVMIFICWLVMFLTASFSALYDEVAADLADAQEEIILHHTERLRSTKDSTRQMAHEVKNPLAAIKGLAQLLVRKGDSPEHARVIVQEVERLQATMDGYLSMSQPLQAVEAEPVEIGSFVQDTLRVFSARFAQKGIEVELRALPSLTVQLSPHRMKQVFYNLWLNAIEAFDEFDQVAHTHSDSAWRDGIGRRYVAISGEAKSSQTGREGIALSVSDNGPGFPKREIDLSRFLQLNTTTKLHGSGLGLTICLNIVEAHGGMMSLHHASSGGAEIRIWLPVDAS